MRKFRRIIKNRAIKEKTYLRKMKPLEVFENRMKEAILLEGEVMAKKLSEKSLDEAKNQMIVTIISCYEAYVKDTFKIVVEENLAPIDKLLKIKKLNNLSFNIKDVESIQKNKIKTSEIICDSINFQNFDQMKEAYSVIELTNRFNEKIKNKKDIMPSPRLKLNKELPKEEVAAEYINYFFKQYSKNKKTFTFDKLEKEIKMILELRHSTFNFCNL